MRPAPRQALRARAEIHALRSWRAPRPFAENVLPMALLAHGNAAMVGKLKLLGIDADRYERELQRGQLQVFKLGRTYALEIPHTHLGPWTDYLVEAN
jgi:hypothetical protein